MNTICRSFIVFAGLALASGLFAQQLPNQHHGLKFKTVSTTYKLLDADDKDDVDVVWKVEDAYNKFINGEAYDTLRYTVTITLASEKTVNLSLLTLGLHPVGSDIFIREATAKDGSNGSPATTKVEFYESEDSTTPKAAPTLASAPLRVPRVGPVSSPLPGYPNHEGPNPKRIWFLSLTKAKYCTIIVEIAGGSIYGSRIGTVGWAGSTHPGSEHDNMPPTDPPW